MMYYLDSYFRLIERAPIESAIDPTYSFVLVALSISISTLASLVAMSVVERLRDSNALVARVLLITLGGLALGIGIWAMHFIGMLAFKMPMGVGYDPLITILSVVPGLIAGTIAIMLLGRMETPRIPQIIVAGVIVGAGIGTMHYIGMAAMMMAADLLYDIPLVLLSVVVAATLATVSLSILFLLRRLPRLYQMRLPISAVFMGCAVAGMHYTAMAAAIFVPSDMSAHAGHDTLSAPVLSILIIIFVALLFSAVFAVVFASQQIQTKRSLEKEILSRQAAEITRARSEAQLNAALASMSGGLLVLDGSMKVMVLNDRLRDLYDLPSDVTYVGAAWRDTLCYRARRGDFGDGDPDTLADAAIDTIKTSSPYRKMSRIGESRVVEAHWSAVGSGGYVAIVTDITEMTEMTGALRQAQVQAEGANEAKSRFLATMSHEIRTPMNAIIGMIDVMREGELANDQREIADVIRDSSFSLLKLINDILDFSKIEATGVQLERTPLSVVQIVEGVCDALAWTARQRHIQLVVSFGNYDLRPVYGDPLRLRQILFNLVGNAIKFTETTVERTGEVRLTINTFDAVGGKKRIRLEVRDNGIGMSDEARESLFLPFAQAESSTTRKYGGTGLGLSIVAKLLAAMKGRIEVESAPGVGSAFIVELDADLAPASDSAEVKVPDLAGIEAWVAAGHPQNRRTALEILKLMGADASEIRLEATRQAGIAGFFSGGNGAARTAIVVLDDETDSLRPSLRRLATEQGATLRFVTLRADRRQDNDRAIDTVSVDANPLKFTTFAHAAAVAAGKSSPVASQVAPRVIAVAQQSRDEAVRNGTLVLVVEDNRNNQLVIMRQLALLGYACDIASNGIEALTLMAQANYGVILTDCHMPLMDGFELTRQIRQSERDSGKRQKIIAITANALQGEAEHCIACGMDFYLSKPIELSKLAGTMKTWLPNARKPAEASATPARAEPPIVLPSSDAINIASIVELYDSDDPAIISATLSDFIEISTTDAEALFAAVRSDDRRGIRDLGHKLKSTARSVGALDLAKACEDAETSAFSAADTTIFARVEPEFRRAYRFAVDYLARAQDRETPG